MSQRILFLESNDAHVTPRAAEHSLKKSSTVPIRVTGSWMRSDRTDCVVLADPPSTQTISLCHWSAAPLSMHVNSILIYESYPELGLIFRDLHLNASTYICKMSNWIFLLRLSHLLMASMWKRCTHQVRSDFLSIYFCNYTPQVKAGELIFYPFAFFLWLFACQCRIFVRQNH